MTLSFSEHEIWRVTLKPLGVHDTHTHTHLCNGMVTTNRLPYLMSSVIRRNLKTNKKKTQIEEITFQKNTISMFR